jgi:CheY-like chemotaxis protein
MVASSARDRSGRSSSRAGNRAVTTILIVDDEPLIVDILAEVLQDEGYDVLTAHNGRAALAAVDNGVPGLVLMDVMMPGMDGHEAYRAIRAHPRGKGIPVVLMSAAVKPSLVDPGVSAFLPKPIDLDKLLGLVARLLGSA